MIFQKEHIERILNGEKTQTRRIHKGKYREGQSYAIQPCRICKGIEGYRIVMDRVWKEICISFGIHLPVRFYNYISDESAWAEGGYTPEEFEKVFQNLNPNWNGIIRYGFEFHVIEVRR